MVRQGYWLSAFWYAKTSNFRRNFGPTRSVEDVGPISCSSDYHQRYPVNNYGLNLIDQIDTQHNESDMQSGRQTARRLIIFRRTCRCTPAILLCAYSYAGSSNCGRFGQILWRIIRQIREAVLWAKAAQGQAQSSSKNRRGTKCCCVGLSFRRTIVTFC